MLFFFGTGTSTIGSYPLTGVSCINCGTRDSVAVTVYSRYLHLFWIPLIPLGKNSVSACGHCQQVLRAAQMPPAYQAPALALQQRARLPVTNYLALAVLGTLFVVLMVVGLLHSKNRPTSQPPAGTSGTSATTLAPEDGSAAADPAANEAPLAAPQVADLYAIRNPDHHYSLMRVARVAPDTLYFQTSTYRPASLADVAAHKDSVQRKLNTFLVPMPRANMRALNQTKLLTILRD